MAFNFNMPKTTVPTFSLGTSPSTTSPAPASGTLPTFGSTFGGGDAKPTVFTSPIVAGGGGMSGATPPQLPPATITGQQPLLPPLSFGNAGMTFCLAPPTSTATTVIKTSAGAVAAPIPGAVPSTSAVTPLQFSLGTSPSSLNLTTAAATTAPITVPPFTSPLAATAPITIPSTISGFAPSTATTATATNIGLTATTATPVSIVAAAATSSATTTASSTPSTVTTTSITHGQLEDSINKWTSELEEQSKFFINQAKQLNAWDSLLVANGDKVLSLNETVEKVKLQQQQMDQELDFVQGQQNELETLCVSLEKQLAEVPNTDQQRYEMYQMSEGIDAQLKTMSDDLKDIIEHLNEANQNEDASDPVVQIGRILNAHMNLLQCVDRDSTQILGQLDQIKKVTDTKKHISG